MAVLELLPAGAGDWVEPVSGRVFKIEHGPGGEKIAYVRMFAGTLRTRDRVRFSRFDGARDGGRQGKLTAIGVFEHFRATVRTSVSVGQIGTLRRRRARQPGQAGDATARRPHPGPAAPAARPDQRRGAAETSSGGYRPGERPAAGPRHRRLT